MKFEWWMIDGIIGLILLVAAFRGAVKGIGDTVLRIAGFIGGLVLAVLFSGRLADFLMTTKLRTKLHEQILKIFIKEAEMQYGTGAGEAASTELIPQKSSALTSVQGDNGGSILDELPKALGDLSSSIEGKVADSVADNLTTIAVSVIAFVLVMLLTWLVVFIIRRILKAAKDTSILIGFADRVLGFTLGVIRGTLIVCVLVAALVPVTTLVAPLAVPRVMEALQETYVAKVIYDINPVLLVIRLFLLK